MTETRARYGLQIVREDALQATLQEMLDLKGALWFHDVDARRNQSGLPDLVWPEPERHVLHAWELKTATGQYRGKQAAWAEALLACVRVDYRLVRPADLDDIRMYLGLRRGA